MKTSLLIVLVFAIIAITVAPNPKSKKNATRDAQDPEKTASTEAEKTDPTVKKDSELEEEPKIEEGPAKKKAAPKSKVKKATPKDEIDDSEDTDDVAPAKSSKKGSKPASKKKPPKKQAKEEDEDIEIDEDVDDILNDKDDEDVEIPSLNQLTTTSNPIELAQKIANIADEDKRNELIEDLRNLWKANKKSLPGKFYGAVLVALKDAKRASKFWTNELEKATQKVEEASSNFVGKARKGLGSAMEDTRKIIEADPIGMQLARNESVLLSALSDAAKNLGKLTVSGYDAGLNASGIVRALTSPVDAIPILGAVKNNVHNTIEDQLKRGRYIAESMAENNSQALANAAKDAEQKADQKQNFLTKQFSSRRTL